jgi:hypothetical protein
LLWYSKKRHWLGDLSNHANAHHLQRDGDEHETAIFDEIGERHDDQNANAISGDRCWVPCPKLR